MCVIFQEKMVILKIGNGNDQLGFVNS